MVDHQVNLQVARWRRIPIGEGPHRYIAAQRLLPPASEPAARRCPDGLEQPVQDGGAGRQQSLAHPRVQTRWPWRSRDSTRWGNAAFSRLLQIRSAASQTTFSACRTASSWMRRPFFTAGCCSQLLPDCPSNLMPCLRWWPVTAGC